jgi:hypothetical protein
LSDGGSELRIGDGIESRCEIFGEGLFRRRFGWSGARFGSLHVGAHDEAERADFDTERLHAFEDLRRQESELLRPGRRRGVHREHSRAQASGLGPVRDAFAHGASPAFAIENDAARPSARVARLFEENSNRRGRTLVRRSGRLARGLHRFVHDSNPAP